MQQTYWGGCSDSEARLLWFYALTYVGLVCVVAGILGSCLSLKRRYTGSALLATLVDLRLRWLWLLAVVGLAGLPPVFIFGPKLGLLLSLLESGVSLLALALGLSVFLGWVVYFHLGQRVTGAFLPSKTAKLGANRLHTIALYGLALGFCVMLSAAVILDDWFLAVVGLMG